MKNTIIIMTSNIGSELIADGKIAPHSPLIRGDARRAEGLGEDPKGQERSSRSHREGSETERGDPENLENRNNWIASPARNDRIPPELLAELKKYFRIEFLNRIDDIVVYDVLTEKEISQITTLMLSDVEARLREQGITVMWEPSLLERIAVLGYDPSLGARPLKRAIIGYIVNPLSEKILLGEVKEGDKIGVRFGEKDELLLN